MQARRPVRRFGDSGCLRPGVSERHLASRAGVGGLRVQPVSGVCRGENYSKRLAGTLRERGLTMNTRELNFILKACEESQNRTDDPVRDDYKKMGTLFELCALVPLLTAYVIVDSSVHCCHIRFGDCQSNSTPKKPLTPAEDVHEFI
ncbi:uncharacterized protein FAM241A isoform X3 [Molossus molossus]|uniref:uncharacterized protein FAM241A isoform X3 n=1 Tax=Molossus molossus TaxID=27622 RepID=UPI001745DC50|nr:uncharacterized protein FAM241A isoform X3 [Molossus molossus]